MLHKIIFNIHKIHKIFIFTASKHAHIMPSIFQPIWCPRNLQRFGKRSKKYILVFVDTSIFLWRSEMSTDIFSYLGIYLKKGQKDTRRTHYFQVMWTQWQQKRSRSCLQHNFLVQTAASTHLFIIKGCTPKYWWCTSWRNPEHIHFCVLFVGVCWVFACMAYIWGWYEGHIIIKSAT